MEVKDLLEKSKLNISKEKILFNEPMKKYTSFKIGGPAECLIKVETQEELKEILNFSKEENISVTILGNGSNMLVLDEGIKGIVLKVNIKKTEIIQKEEYMEIKVGAGNKMLEFAQKLLQNEITGFEELSGIPGTIGGAIKMNAGAYKKEMKDIVISVSYMDYDGNIYEEENSKLEFSYRQSIFSKEKYIILGTTLKLHKGEKKEIKSKMDEYAKSRNEKQPVENPSAGSTFKRGDDFITAKLIDEAGLKGYRIGGAVVSNKHAGFVVNDNNATAKDVLDLVEHIKKVVYEKFKKELKMEIEILGQ